ncbi:MAG TPA: hypothetical protein VIB00_17060 [Pyrinomonadaceae bacterium]
MLLILCGATSAAKPIHHYVFFGQDREKIRQATSFLEMKTFEGAQIAYTWRRLEPQKDEYDFTAIREDLEFLKSKGKKLFIQLQDVSFSERWNPVPRYLIEDPAYNGGANRQYDYKEGAEDQATPAGWMSRRFDPAVQERFHKLLAALGKEFDGRIEGINFAESAVSVGETGRLFPKGFTFEIYRDGLITNMRALKRAFPKSVVLQYANFMPGEWQPNDDKGYLRSVYKAALELGVGVGGPDLLPYKPGQMNNSYHLIKNAAGTVPVGVAVQDGNYAHLNPQTKKQVSIAEIIAFATDYLKVDYIFWCTEEPYFSEQLIPFFKSKRAENTATHF